MSTRKIGLIGGMSWKSTAVYYQLLNEITQQRFGEFRSATTLLYSVDFAEIVQLQRAGAWHEAGQLLADAARRLEAAGAEMIMIGAVTMHKVADAVQQAVGIPLLHIADVTAAAIKTCGLTKVGLLGTKYTMEDAFFHDKLKQHGIETIVPAQADRDEVHRVIFEELTKGTINQSSKQAYITIIERLRALGAEGIVLGCTEIPMLIGSAESPLPVFDTTYLHVVAALNA